MTTEQDIELNFIETLQNLKYVYNTEVKDKNTLERNFRKRVEALNFVELEDAEFARLLHEIVEADVFSCAKKLRETNYFERDDGTPLHYTLVNTKDWCKNTFEVVNQVRINTDNSHHRYDVMLLINGIPVVQVELKTQAISPRRAMEQIIEYKNDVGNGYSKTLLCFLQLFIVSNSNDTWYFANNNSQHFSFNADERFLPLYQYADKDNKKITQLSKFSESFLAKCTLAEIISRYMVLVTSEQKILIMRPYQIYAVQAIMDSIEQNSGNGYIWHTTGSGKTLTSFKASTLLKANPFIEKCLFVVDRKDLDRQTRLEFNNFQENCVEENTNTETLVDRLLSSDYADKVIVTTIQKLALALNESSYRERLKYLSEKRMVFIFDECHRSQFGDNHKAIRKFFPNSQLFGFTGTPIFETNAVYTKISGEEAKYQTTDDIFQYNLHTYTITHAIEDKNVLRFNVDYYQADTQKISSSKLKQAIVERILEKHNTATSYRKFNAIFATSSINDAIEYYELFKEKQKNMPVDDANYLNIACVFSPPASGNKEIQQLQEDLVQEKIDNAEKPELKKKALTEIINDYNNQFSTNHSINEFDEYYKDVQKRIKDQKYSKKDLAQNEKIDIVIVVDMLLTGFDSKYLNTLYVDKKLKWHGLIQAFSRTNRVLNDSKPNGNILDFRGQKLAVDEAVKMFSGENEQKAREIWLVDPAPTVIEKMSIAVDKLNKFMQSQGLEATPNEVVNLKGDAAKAQFINLFKDVQKLKTQLDQYTDLSTENIENIESIISNDSLQGFKGVYLETAKDLRDKQNKKSDTGAEVEELDFDFVIFTSDIIDYDYIMKLIANYTNESPERQELTRNELIGIIASDAKFMNNIKDIKAYIMTLSLDTPMTVEEVKNGFVSFMNKYNQESIQSMAFTHGLSEENLNNFINAILKRMIFDGDKLRDLLKPLNLGWKERAHKELALMADLAPFLRKKAEADHNGQNIAGLEHYED